MSVNRRKFLKIIGGGTIVAASGTGAFLTTRTPSKALAPWQQAGTYEEPRRRALSWAILAPNPHNRQPWLIDLSTKDAITLYVDLEKLLPHTDPFNRQITIGLGCFLELLRMAAAEDGYRADIEGFPEGFDAQKLDKRPVARIKFTRDPATAKDPLFAYVRQRRSLKKPFDLERKVPDTALIILENTVQNDIGVGTTNKVETIKSLRQLTSEAMAIEMKIPRTYQESVDLFRIGKSEINANPDGISLGGPLLDTLAAFGMFSRKAARDMGSSTYKQGIDTIMANIETAMGYVWLTSKTNTRLDQLNAGRDWLRINLETTAQGIGLHPISQALQEYAEMKDKFRDLQKMLGTNGKTIQMLGRLGYAAQIPPSPRWPLDAKIMKV